MNARSFLRPRFVGGRFDDDNLPFDILQDLPALEAMVVGVAKALFLQDHPGRTRSPRGFTDGVSLGLASIEVGQSVIPEIVLSLGVGAGSSLLLDMRVDYFDRARGAIIDAIEAAESGRSVTEFLPENALAYFDRFGRGLRDREAIVFRDDHAGASTRLTRESRRRLVLASKVSEFTEEIEQRGSIPQADQDGMRFHLKLPDGRKVPGPIARQHLEDVIKAFDGYKSGVKVRLDGVGKYDRAGHLQEVLVVDRITILDPLDVRSRLEELRYLKDGWLDGNGVALSTEGLDWFAAEFERRYPDELALPFVYPIAEGGIQLEWSMRPREVSIEVDLQNHSGEYYSLDLETDVEAVESFDFDDELSWDKLADLLRDRSGAEA